MKKCILGFITLSLILAGAHAVEMVPQNNFAAYIAGIEMINADKTLSLFEQSCRYRKLRAITGVGGEQAKAFLLRYKNDPAGWQKFETMVLDLLQKKG
jgi:hypothetical protein